MKPSDDRRVMLESRLYVFMLKTTNPLFGLPILLADFVAVERPFLPGFVYSL